MQDGDIGEAAAGRARRSSWVAATEFLSIVPRGPREHGPEPSPPPQPATACPEIDCVRDQLSDGVIAAAERRAAELGVGADRVVIASGLISEEDYVRAFAASCGAEFMALDDMPRSWCPLPDDRLFEAATTGILPLHIDNELVLVVAPRGTAARLLAGLFAAKHDLTARFRFTCAERLQRFVVRHGNDLLARRAVEDLKTSCPRLSAAPQPRHTNWMKFIVFAALALASAIVAPEEALATIDVLLAVLFIAWIVLRLFGSLVKHPEPRRSNRLSDDKLPVYTVIAALYRESASVEHLAGALRQLDYPALGSKCTKAIFGRLAI